MKPNWACMDRVVKDGHVAVLYSPNFGAGWSTWNQEYDAEDLVFDPGLVNLILEGRDDEDIKLYVTLKWPDAYMGGLAELAVRWIPLGTRFQIHEDDGNEIVIEYEEVDWFIA